MSELFLAEAAVLIKPDTTQFRVQLEAELRAATRTIPPVVVPITAAPVGGPQLAQQTAAVQQASAQLAQLSSTTAATTAVTTRAATASRAKTEAQKLEARAASQLAVAQEQVLNSTTALGAAQIQATRSATALANARRANAALTAADSAATREAVANTLALAEAQNVQAQTALRQAQANAAAGTQMSQLTRGASSATASMLGVRGATLAATGPFLAATVAVTTFGKAISSATDFAQQMAVFGATTEATAGQLERVSQAARELGRDITLPGITAGSAAEAMTELARAGLTVQDSINGARGVLQLATAAQLSNADATLLTASALNAFGLGGAEAVRVADLLANAANAAQGGIEEMGLALRQSAGVARQVGISLDDTVALLTVLARNGLQGSDAGTALRTSLIRLINPTKEARDVLRELNVELRDQQGNIRPEVFADFAAAQANLSRTQQDANAAIVFGQDAIRALAILGREGERGLNRVSVALEKQGTAARLAGARMTGLTGETQNLLNQLDSLALVVGEKATPFLEKLVAAAADGVEDVNDLVKAFGELERQLDRLPGSEGVQGKVEGFLGDALTNPIGLFAPITKLVKDESDESTKAIGDAGADIRSALEDAAREAVRGAESFEDQIVGGIQAAFRAANAAIDAQRASFRNASLRAIRGGEGQAAGLEEQFNQILAAGGNDQAQIANLERQARVQAKIIERAGPDAAGVALQARRAAQARLAQINSQIESLEEGIVRAQEQAAADVRSRAREAQQARSDADRAFVDLIRGRIEAADNSVIIAEATSGLNDDIKAEQRKRAILRRSIEVVRETVQDAKTRAAELQRLVREDIETRNRINELLRERREAEALEAQERRDAVSENLAKRTRLAELRGNDNAILAALNRQIADARKRVAAAKKAKDGVLDEQIALQELINARRDLVSDLKEGEEGTTAFELLTQAAERFGSFAGNLIGADQPFAGPTEFTADISQFLRRNQEATTTKAVTPRGPDFAGFQGGVDRLVTALDRNTLALNGGTAGNPVRRGTRAPVSGAIERNDRRWLTSAQARETIEGAGG